MKKAIDIIPRVEHLREFKEHIHSSPTTLNEDVIDFVNHLFNVFSIHIKAFNLFASSTEKVDFAKKEWVISLSNARITKELVAKGANRVRENGFIYMITPSEFIDLCFDKKDARPQTDTRCLEFHNDWNLKSEDEKERLKQSGKAQCFDLLWKLRRGEF